MCRDLGFRVVLGFGVQGLWFRYEGLVHRGSVWEFLNLLRFAWKTHRRSLFAVLFIFFFTASRKLVFF